MQDGIYQVTTSYLCAGFTIKNGQCIECAPILRKKFNYWATIAVKVGELPKVIVLLDVSNMLHRVLKIPAFFELQYNNIPTGGVFGMAKTLQTVFNSLPSADKVIAIQDSRHSARRAKIYPEYKQNRKPKTDTDRLVQENYFRKYNHQLQIIVNELFPSLGILPLQIDGKEADDLIYKVSSLCQNHEVVILSEDRDLLQLINVFPKLKVFRPIANEVITVENFKQTQGVDPKAFLLYKAILGDKSDGITNISGVGDTTALSLINSIDLNDQINSLMVKTKEASELKPTSREAKVYKGWDIIARNLELIDLSREEFTNAEVMDICTKITGFKRSINKDQFINTCKNLGMVSVLRDVDFFLLPFQKGLLIP